MKRAFTPPPERLGSVTRKIGTPRQWRFLRGLVLTIMLLNVIDAFLTLRWIQGGYATEANPIMADLAHNDPGLFVGVKFLLVLLGALLLWRLRKRKVAVVAIFVIFLSYYFVLLYHLQAMRVGLWDRLFG